MIYAFTLLYAIYIINVANNMINAVCVGPVSGTTGIGFDGSVGVGAGD